jgi:hypothetical protein
MSESILPELLDDLQARLAAAGATDADSLQHALDADPELRRDLEAFAPDHQEQIAQYQLAQFLAVFVELPDRNALAAFRQRVPQELEVPFIELVQAQIAQAEQEGASDLAAALHKRLDDLQRLRAEQFELAGKAHRWALALVNAPDAASVRQIWDEIPVALEDTVLKLVEQVSGRFEQQGDTEAAASLRTRVDALRQLQQHKQELPPYVRALRTFLWADTDDAARLVFAEQRDLLQPHEAQQVMDEWAAQATDELRERVAARCALLRELRGAAPTTGRCAS